MGEAEDWVAKSWTFTKGTGACLSDTIAVRGVGPHSGSEAGDRNVRIPEHRKQTQLARSEWVQDRLDSCKHCHGAVERWRVRAPGASLGLSSSPRLSVAEG